MTEKQTEHPESDFDAQTQLALDIGNNVTVEPTAAEPADDLDFFFGSAAERAKENIAITYVADEEPAEVSHTPQSVATPSTRTSATTPTKATPARTGMGRVEQLVVGSVIGATVIGGIAIGAQGLRQFEQDQADNKKQNQEWAEEAEQQRLLQEQELGSGKLTLDISDSNEQDK